ncbi:hypothetical protein QBZ16_005091 [Prototheca wickerhamii]|uniref:EIF2B subunit epsilon/gamma LbH domain-containing protein n=1 Tax=Prototheca wickerhamii TaxID=3111 RepID=A0AAD9IEJ5_PROWI|nr:hypothetical protein QBZ16_005091 [Prototheca wickerhamii]
MRIARTAKVSHDSCIGPGTVLEDGAVVEGSVIGRDCVVGAGCVLRGAYLFDGVRLQRGASVHSALLCDGVLLREGATVLPGAVLSFGVVVDAGASVDAGAKLSLVQAPGASDLGDSSDDDVEVPARDSQGGGPSASASFFDASDAEDDQALLGLPRASVREAAAALAAGSIPEKTIAFDSVRWVGEGEREKGLCVTGVEERGRKEGKRVHAWHARIAHTS